MLHIYHPSKNSNGFAASFWNSDRDDAVFATLVKQAGWDATTQNGTFKASFDDPEKHISIKLSDTEVAGILDCIERNRPFQSFHDNDDGAKAIQFTPWMAKSNDENVAPQQRGFSFSITATKKQDSTYKNSFYIGLTYPEARLIREFLIFSLNRHFQNVSDRAAMKNSPPKSSAAAPQEII